MAAQNITELIKSTGYTRQQLYNVAYGANASDQSARVPGGLAPSVTQMSEALQTVFGLSPTVADPIAESLYDEWEN